MKLKEKEISNERPFYRNMKQQNGRKPKNKVNWYRKENSNFKTVMFVEPTPDDQLLKMLKTTEEKI